jgi:hypothetical protein
LVGLSEGAGQNVTVARSDVDPVSFQHHPRLRQGEAQWLIRQWSG